MINLFSLLSVSIAAAQDTVAQAVDIVETAVETTASALVEQAAVADISQLPAW